MKKFLKYLLTGLIVVLAVGMVLFKYQDYVTNPWTRNGQVRAHVIQINPRVSGPIVNLPIRDNQFVKAGDLLFEIDPRTFQASLDQARAQLDETGDSVQALEKQVEAARAGVNASRASIAQAQSAIDQLKATIAKNKAEYERKKDLLPKQATSQKAVERASANYEVSLQQKISAEAGLRQAHAALAESQAGLAEARAKLGAVGESNSQVRTSLAAVRQAELNLEFTRVKAPVDGYITNLNLRLGSQAVANLDRRVLQGECHRRHPCRRPGGGHPDDLPRHSSRGSCRQHWLGYCPAGRQHGVRPVAHHQPDLRVDPVGTAGAGAHLSFRCAPKHPAAGGHDLFGPGDGRQWRRQSQKTGTWRAQGTPVRRSLVRFMCAARSACQRMRNGGPRLSGADGAGPK